MERETKMVSSRKPKKSTPGCNPISRRRPTRSIVVISDDDEPSIEAANVATVSSVAEAMTYHKGSSSSAVVGAENLEVDTVSDLNFNNVAVEMEEEKNVDFGVEDKSNDEANVAGVSEEPKNLSCKDVDGENGSCLMKKNDLNVVEEKQQNTKYIHSHHSLLGCNQDSKHSVVEEESPTAEFEGKKPLGSFYDISGVEESDDEKEESGNSEDDGEEEENGSQGSENDGDNSEGSKDYKNDKEGCEDNKDNNEENKDDKERCESIYNPLSKKGTEIHVGGLDKETVDDDLIKVLGKFGEIQDIQIIKHQSRRGNRGFAFIQYATIDQARNAVSESKDGIEVRGKRVKVSASQEKANLIVDNICKSWTKEHVLNKLKDYGIEHIGELHLPNDISDKGKIKGFALLAFSTRKDAMAAHKRLRMPNAVFGCDRSAKVAFVSSQVLSIGDLSQAKLSISKRKPMKSKVTGSESNIPKSRVTENRVVGIPSKSAKINHEKRSHSKSDDRGKRMMEHDYSTRPSKKRQGNKQSTPRNTIRSQGRDPPVRERYNAGYREPAHGAFSGSKSLRSDMEPHAGYVKPSASKQIQHHVGYSKPDLANHYRHHLEPALGSQSLVHAKYFVPALGNRHPRHVSYLEPSLGRELLSHTGYLERATGIQIHNAYHHGFRRDGGYDYHVSNSTYGGGG